MAANSYCMLMIGILVISSIGFFVSFGTSWSLVDVQYASTPAPAWILVGGITSTSAMIKVKLPVEQSPSQQPSYNAMTRLFVSVDTEFSLQTRHEYVLGDLPSTKLERQYGLQTVPVTNLQPQTKYYYKIQSANSMIQKEYEDLLTGHFYTPAREGTRFNFTIAASACAWTGSRAAVFSEIAQFRPLLFLHLGDFHYGDIDDDNLQQRIDAISQVMASDTQTELYSSTAISYIWDDHDWLGDNSDGVEEHEGARETALLSYQMAFPHYPLAALSDSVYYYYDDDLVTHIDALSNYMNHENDEGGDGNSTNTTTMTTPSPTLATPSPTPGPRKLEPVPVYHAYTIGTVRFIITDLRSESNNQSMYSEEQSTWLKRELSKANRYDFVIWASTKPWIGEVDTTEGKWFGYPHDRQDLSEFITTTLGGNDKDAPQNLLVLSADAHMVAFDDGTNTYYGTDNNNNNNEAPPKSFPILQTAPLDRVAKIKGGPFTMGCFGYDTQRTHQFSVLRFEFANDNNDDNSNDGNDNDKCIYIDTYSNDQYAERQGKLLFSKKLCNKIFVDAVVGDHAKVGVCVLDDFWEVNDNIALAASSILLGTMLLTCIAVNKSDAANTFECLCKCFGTTLAYVLSYMATAAVGFGTFFARGIRQADVTPVLIAVLCQACLWFFYLFIWWACCTHAKRRKLRPEDPGFRDVEPNININISDLEPSTTFMNNKTNNEADAAQKNGNDVMNNNQQQQQKQTNNNNNTQGTKNAPSGVS